MNTMIQEDDEEHNNFNEDLLADFSPERYDKQFNSARLNITETVLSTAVNRLFEDATRRKELKERIQLLSAKRELEELKQQPEINKKSEKMLQEKEYIPIHERYEKIINDLEIKKSQKKAEIIVEQQVKNPVPTFQPRTNNPGRQREFQDFLKQSEKWQIEKQLKVQHSQQLTATKASKDCTFKPQINQSSNEIFTPIN